MKKMRGVYFGWKTKTIAVIFQDDFD